MVDFFYLYDFQNIIKYFCDKFPNLVVLNDSVKQSMKKQNMKKLSRKGKKVH